MGEEDASGAGGEQCWSLTNSGPMAMAADNRESLIGTMRELEKEARRLNWKLTRSGWYCPYCSANIAASKKTAGDKQ